LFFTSRESDTYRELHQSVFLQIAGQVSAILEKSRLYERLVAHNHTLLDRTKRLELIATRDPLTSTLNRRAIDTALRERLAEQPESLGVIMSDIDHFKTINDMHGHAAGDLALREFAARLRGAPRGLDVLGRYGGEEFLVILHGLGDDELARSAERLRRAVADRPFVLPHDALNVTASFGFTLAAPGDNPRTLIGRADRALYRAKASGRNRCERG
jgi:diguanylate cyclase (GGDEF)-like protein